jgi:hypothetical protein
MLFLQIVFNFPFFVSNQTHNHRVIPKNSKWWIWENLGKNHNKINFKTRV